MTPYFAVLNRIRCRSPTARRIRESPRAGRRHTRPRADVPVVDREEPPPCSSHRPRPASVTTIPTCRSQRVPVGRRRMTSGDCQECVTVGFWCDDGEKDHHSETTVRMQARRLAPWQATPMRRKARAVRPPAFRCGWNRYGNRHCHDPPPGDRRVGVSPSPRPCAVGRGRWSGVTEVDWAESFVGVGGRPGVPLVGGSGFVSPKLPGGFRARGEDPPTGVQEHLSTAPGLPPSGPPPLVGAVEGREDAATDVHQ